MFGKKKAEPTPVKTVVFCISSNRKTWVEGKFETGVYLLKRKMAKSAVNKGRVYLLN